MTYEEALRLVRQGKYAEADELIIEALEKQIVKKPKIEDATYTLCYCCPTCGEEIYWDSDYGQQHFNYCTECGTKLDWSDDE